VVLGEERPYGNVPSWDSSGRGEEEGSSSYYSSSGNGVAPYTLSIAPMVRAGRPRVIVCSLLMGVWVHARTHVRERRERR
jgi:hypothetical protein